VTWKSIRKRLIGLVGAGFVLYGVVILATLIGRLTIGEAFSPIALVNSLTPVIALPSLVGVVLMLLARKRWIALLLAPTAIVLLVLYAPRFLPRSFVTDPDRTLSILSYNIASRRADFDPIIEIIRESNADIVALQEFQTAAADALTPALADLYPYTQLDPTNRFAVGMGVYSKFPLSEAVYFDALVLGSQRMFVTMPDELVIRLYNAHPVPPRTWGWYDDSLRRAEIALLLDDVAEGDDTLLPTIMAGDFNMSDQSDDYARVRRAAGAGFADAYATVGMGFGPTFPYLGRWGSASGLVPPFIRIDYVFYDPGWWSAVLARVGESSGGSDHYPLHVVLRWDSGVDD